MGFSFRTTGDFKKTYAFLEKVQRMQIDQHLHKAGREGVAALRAATPVETGLAASSWTYEVTNTGSGFGIQWFNTNVENGFQVAIALQYGYATGTGGYVAGRDYINPAIQPIFDKIADDVWKEVTSA